MKKSICRLLAIIPIYLFGLAVGTWYLQQTPGLFSLRFLFLKSTPSAEYIFSNRQQYLESISNGFPVSKDNTDASMRRDCFPVSRDNTDASMRRDCVSCNSTETVLTLFTTIRDSDVRRNIHNITLRNWASLRPALLPVLFLSSDTKLHWLRLASQLGWRVEKAPRLNSGVPVLKDMFQIVLKKYPSPFVGFANADNIFGPSLIQTLKEVGTNNESLVHSRMSLLVGRRKNIPENKVPKTGSSSQFVDGVGSTVKLFHGYAQDYFIVSGRRGLCWENIPDFVVGRVGYDNWLVVKAQRWNVSLIDATATINDVHLVGQDGEKSGFRINTGEQKVLNRAMAGKHFSYGAGWTGCAFWRTVEMKQENISHIVLRKSKRNERKCASPVGGDECRYGISNSSVLVSN